MSTTQHAPRRTLAWTGFVITFVLLVASLGTGAGAQPAQENLRSHYPNIDQIRAGNYLEGFNYVSGEPARSVLWFEERSRNRFRQYNSAPDDPQTRCHWDQLKWHRGILRYQVTQNACGDVTRRVRYRPAIRLMPEVWTPGGDWTRTGTSGVTYSENGTVVCRGDNEWVATVEGYVDIAPGVQAIHVRSRQTTTWTEGQSSAGCAAGFTTEWQEDYYLLPDLPVTGGGTAPAFKRSVGGNLAGGPDRWDVWFDSWEPLPS